MNHAITTPKKREHIKTQREIPKTAKISTAVSIDLSLSKYDCESARTHYESLRRPISDESVNISQTTETDAVLEFTPNELLRHPHDTEHRGALESARENMINNSLL